MKNLKLKSALLPLIIAMPAFAAQAGSDVTKEALQKQLNEIQARLVQMEQITAPEASSTLINLYGSLRPTFGITSTDDEDNSDVGDALSRIGIAVEHKLSNGMVGFAKGEFKVDIQGTGDFGRARKAYVERLARPVA